MNMKAKLLILGVLSVFAMAFVSSCKDEESFVKAESVSISPAKVTLTAGEHTELTATVAPNNATSKYFKWVSSDAKVASVDNFGRVVALSPGSTTITVTTDDGGFKATSEIIVNPKPVQSVSFDKAEITVYENETATLVAIVNPSDATDQSVTWSTSDKDIATVDKNGVVTGQATGEAVVTATTTDGGKTASCKVKVEARVPTEPEQLELWKNDKAGYRPIIGGDASVDKGWLTYKDGVVRWTENTTGSPRTATIEFTTGSRITVTQLSPADFKGSWTLYSKLFDPNKTLGKGNVNADKTTVTFGNPLNGETLADANGAEHVNNVGVKGLYLDSILDACVEIDYKNKTAKVGLFLDRRKSLSLSGGKFCVYLPECSGGNGWGNYNFAPKDFSETNYDWLWFTAKDNFKTLKYQYFGAGQKTSNGKYYICGVSIAKATSADNSTISGSYDVVYQANYNGSNGESMYFAR